MAPHTTITTSSGQLLQRPESPTMRQPRFWRSGASIQTMSLVMHRSRMVPSADPTRRRYLVSTAMLLVELIKLVASLTVACHAQLRVQKKKQIQQDTVARITQICRSIYEALFSSGSWMLILPAGLYALQTRLVYIAVSNMETVPFQVTYQLKILTTVLFSIVMVQRVITPRQWIALVLLTLGVAIVQVADSTPSSTSIPASFSLANLGGLLVQMCGQMPNNTLEGAATSTTPTPPLAGVAYPRMNTTKGFVAAITAAFISGFTGVYFEKLIKESRVSVSLWTRNAQLSFYSLFPIAILGAFWKDGAAIAEHGFFAGYGPTVWATILLQALGGILVAICITYADNVAKNLAASFSIVVSYLANAVLFGEPMTLNSSIGIATVLASLYLYQRSSTRPPGSPLLPIDKNDINVQSKELHEK
ncbi:UDP-galactose transporter Gms1 [Sporothrix curviconia]|uniref:UDP-galactose transporter Gms1 n=1 Tax=Sporothrix curviconia TaxID=1260050 RepID=A0ABP0AUM9_9PEZI